MVRHSKVTHKMQTLRIVQNVLKLLIEQCSVTPNQTEVIFILATTTPLSCKNGCVHYN
jgi:hypothetical protein